MTVLLLYCYIATDDWLCLLENVISNHICSWKTFEKEWMHLSLVCGKHVLKVVHMKPINLAVCKYAQTPL